MALLLSRRRQFRECIDLCSKLLESNPNDQMMLYVKCNALLQSSWVVVDDTDLEEEGVVDLLLDLNRVAAMPRLHPVQNYTSLHPVLLRLPTGLELH